jgi:hypothetical protein
LIIVPNPTILLSHLSSIKHHHFSIPFNPGIDSNANISPLSKIKEEKNTQMFQVNSIKDLSKSRYLVADIAKKPDIERKTVHNYLGKDVFSPQPPTAEIHLKRRQSILTAA